MGFPFRVHSTHSGAEAKKLLSSFTTLGGHMQLAVALIDVVMETDTAGLDLCRHIREELGNTTTQLFVRTGQAGKAPERSVIDRYDISGYISKVEATEDRLYTLVKSGVRQYLHHIFADGFRRSTNALIAHFTEHGRKETALFDFLRNVSSAYELGTTGKPTDRSEWHNAHIVDGTVHGHGEYANPSWRRRRPRSFVVFR